MPGQPPPAVDFTTYRVEIIPGQITVPLGFDLRIVAVVADSRTGEVLYDTGPEGILLSEWVARMATAVDLAPVVQQVTVTAVLTTAGVAIDG